MGATNARIAASLAAVMIFSVISYYRIDIPVAIFCRGLDIRILDTFEWISTLGESTWYLVGAFGLFLYFKRIRRNEVFANRALFVFASVAVSGTVTLFIKMIFGRFRPTMFFQEGLYGLNFFHPSEDLNSFPSGHAATALSLAFALSLLFPRYRFPLFLFGLLVAISRTVTTAHFLSDTVAGAWIGIVTVCLLRRELIRRNKSQWCGS
ncbi:MAG TPA: phosphatase PAP2 family protein [Syntrophales bacterium]|nr:phosphatase PAP2 family protein [Syntrophales bacterium]